MSWQPLLTSPDGCLGNCASTEEAEHIGCTPSKPQEMAQCSFPSLAETLVCMEGIGEFWAVPQIPEEAWQGHEVTSSGEIISRWLFWDQKGMESPEEGAHVGEDTGSQQCHCSLVRREGCRGAARAQAAESWCFACIPKPGISSGTGSVFGPLGGASCPFAVGKPAQARAVGLHFARCFSSGLCV